MPVSVNDCQGLPVVLPKQLIESLTPAFHNHDSYDDLPQVIQNPSLIIENHSGTNRYYFRAIGWDLTALIKVELQKEKWIATSCLINPAHGLLMDLLKEGKFLEA